jgi:hypothetical protein
LVLICVPGSHAPRRRVVQCCHGNGRADKRDKFLRDAVESMQRGDERLLDATFACSATLKHADFKSKRGVMPVIAVRRTA